MFCPKCGYKLENNDAFCGSCGFAINSTKQNSTPNINTATTISVNNREAVNNVKPFLIASFLLLITNPFFSSLNLFNAYNPFTQEKENYEYISLISFILELGLGLPFIYIIAILGFILLLISAYKMIAPVIRKSKSLPNGFALAKIISIIALLANAGMIAMVYIESMNSGLTDIIKLSFGGVITIIACILLVVSVFVAAAKVKDEQEFLNK